MNGEDKNEESRYLKLADDFEQLRYGFDGIEKAKGGLKLLGKGLFNVGKYAVIEVLPKMAEEAAKRKRES